VLTDLEETIADGGLEDILMTIDASNDEVGLGAAGKSDSGNPQGTGDSEREDG